MKVYFHPASTTSRPILMLCAEANIAFEPKVVDLMTGAHHNAEYLKLNPNAQVPVIDDDGFVLTEVSSILKYLADKHDLAVYPKDLKKRARVNEAMDWFNSNFYKEWGYNLIYPQVFSHHKRPSDDMHKGVLDWGLAKSERWLGILDQSMLAGHKFLAGDDVTIADYFGAEVIGAGDLIGVSLSKFPNVDRWMKAMRALPSWAKVHEVADGFAASLKGKPFVTVG